MTYFQKTISRCLCNPIRPSLANYIHRTLCYCRGGYYHVVQDTQLFVLLGYTPKVDISVSCDVCYLDIQGMCIFYLPELLVRCFTDTGYYMIYTCLF